MGGVGVYFFGGGLSENAKVFVVLLIFAEESKGALTA